MTTGGEVPSRRGFVKHVGRVASAAAVAGALAPGIASAGAPAAASMPTVTGPWDMSWLARLTSATDRAVFDWPTLGNPADPIVLELAERYLANCAAVYGSQRYEARIVLNIRTQAVAAALNDAMWQRYSLGVEYKTDDPTTGQPAVRNPFWHQAPDPVPGISLPSLGSLQAGGAIILVCDFALTNLSRRLAPKVGASPELVHETLRGQLVPGAFAMPSGIFGLARAQNAGCALVHI